MAAPVVMMPHPMSQGEIQQAIQMIDSEQDTNVKQLLLAALVSELFRERGFEPVVVGGSAIEFYTDGAYVSGDVDICWKGARSPTLVQRAEVLRQIPGGEALGTCTWKIGNLYVDLLGEVTTQTPENYVASETPLGLIVLQPVEDLLVERVFSARCWTGPNAIDEACARKLMAAILRGDVGGDWAEIERIAALPQYQCLREVRSMKQEVEASLEKS